MNKNQQQQPNNLNKDIFISIVSPVYQAEQIVDKLVKEIITHISKITSNFEIILVEDGSRDKSWEKISTICRNNRIVKGIKLSRNFGQHYAITAGLDHTKGEWIIVMDCDLQDKPDQIHKLWAKTKEGFSIVLAKRELRQDRWLKKLSSKAFYKAFGYLTDTKQDPSIANFGLYHRKVIDAILEMRDHIRYFPTMVQWVGFRKTSIPIEHGEREAGDSSYSWRKLINLAINNIIAFSDKPLRLTVQFGFLITIISGLIGGIYISRYLLGQIIVEGFTSLILSLWFLSGIIIFFLGMIGIYLGKTFERVKNRPTYIIEENIN